MAPPQSPQNESPQQLAEEAWKLIAKYVSSSGPREQSLGWLGRRRVQKAESMFQKALTQDPKCARAQWGQGALYWLAGNQQEAFPCYQDAVKLADAPMELVRDLSVLALYVGDAAVAETMARKAIDLSPNSPELLCNYALALTINDEGRRALGVITNAWKLDQNRGATWDVLVYIRRIVNGEEPRPDRLEV